MSDTIKRSLQAMYDLGYGHGYEIGKKDAEIERLTKELLKDSI